MTTVEEVVYTGPVREVSHLDSAPAGQAIMVRSATVGNRVWVKEVIEGEHWWRWEDHRVRGHNFVGGVDGGHLAWHTVLPSFSPGLVLAVGRYTYIVYEVLGDGRARVGAFRDAGWVGFDEVNPAFLTRNDVSESTLDERAQGAWVTGLLTSAGRERQQLIEQRDQHNARLQQAIEERNAAVRDRNAAQQETLTLRTSQATVPQGLVNALHGYAGEVDDEQFDDILRNNGIGRQTDVTVTVTIIGHSYAMISEEQAAQQLGIARLYITDIDDASTVRWRKRFTVTRQTSDGSCVCEDVNDSDDDVTAQAPGEYETFEIDETYCEND